MKVWNKSFLFARHNWLQVFSFFLCSKNTVPAFLSENIKFKLSLSNIFASFAFDPFCVMYSGAPLHDKRLWCFLSVILPDCPRAQRVWDYCREKTSEMTFCSLFSPCLSCCLSPHTDTAGSMSDMLLYCWQLLLSVCSSASVSVALMVYKGLMKAVLLFIALVHLPSCCLIVRHGLLESILYVVYSSWINVFILIKMDHLLVLVLLEYISRQEITFDP